VRQLRIGEDGERTSLVQLCGAGSLRDVQTRLRCARCNDKAARLVILPPV
jgi:hypothetical protein